MRTSTHLCLMVKYSHGISVSVVLTQSPPFVWIVCRVFLLH